MVKGGGEVNDNYFIKIEDEYIEGHLGKAEDTRLLIVLKDPNSNDEAINQLFWMKDCVLTRKTGSRYYHVLGALARFILKTDNKKSALEQCAYINLYPFSGKSSAKNSKYSAVFSQLKNIKYPVTNAEKLTIDDAIKEDLAVNDLIDKYPKELQKIAANRLKIIENMLDQGCSVLTVKEIYYELIKHFDLKETPVTGKKEGGICEYNYFTYNNGEKDAKVYWYQHPSFPRINYTALGESLGFNKRINEID